VKARAALTAWAGVCLAGLAADAAARGGVGAPHVLFFACACLPIAFERWAEARRAPATAALAASVWLVAAAALIATADDRGGLFAVWLAAPVAVSLAQGRSARVTAEAAGLAALAAVTLWLSRGLRWEGPELAYGALPLVSAAALGVIAGFAAMRSLSRGDPAARAQAAERRLEAVLEASLDIFLSVDRDGRIAAVAGGRAGEHAARLGAVLGGDATAIVREPEREQLRRMLEAVRRTGEPEQLALSGAGGRIDLRATRAPSGVVVLAVRPADAEVEASLAAAAREREMAEAAARDRSRFFASMSHELRTPLNAILGFSDMMRVKLFGPLPAKYAEHADYIHESARHLLDLVGDMLDVSRIEAGRYELEIERFDARDAVQGAARMIRPSADARMVNFCVSAGASAIDVEADRRALKQMVLNLASNAVKFTEKGGVVTIAARGEGGDLVVEVSDTGPGLTPEEIARLGEPYAQARNGRRQEGRSSGLGLSLVRSLSELHRGRLEVESTLGKGSVFRLRLPVLAAPEQGENGDCPPTLRKTST
jgi:cell cycle sensor histidine kinase DivJ